MSFKNKVKLASEKIPPQIGIALNYIPFTLRLGSDYKRYSGLTERLINSDKDTRQAYLLEGFNKVLKHFSSCSPFYSQFLKANGVSVTEINSISDICRIPLMTKSSLKAVPIDDRTIKDYALKQFNTGGTSGNPLSFYAARNYYPREWAHMHYMWRKIGYTPSRTKITIRGRNLDNVYLYNFNQNEFLINSYHSFTTKEYDDLLRLFKKYNTEFIHGYPSSIYNFLKEISVQAPALLDFLKSNIKGIMLGSEYPTPHYRNYIEELLTKNTISWYGHTEGVILAGELYRKFEYVPFLSYGYTEAVEKDGCYHLVGTAFDNFASPFIRYDTEDLIDPEMDDSGLLNSFKIKEGRLGESVLDRNKKSISLTALIFGRHHKLFDMVDFIQVQQIEPGAIIVYYSSSDSIENPMNYFDTTNLDLDVMFRHINEPFKTNIGKIPLLIK
ncbi:MAG TPA: CoF synthetase [Bacteroidales bacterium]|nr:CoF synthetase [Bacteroidales bacterium]HPT20314.1 CoF synthetase [Bacteroidales bacterium]